MKWLSGLFPHAKPVRYVLTAFVLVFIGMLATTCRADEIHMEVGSQLLRGTTPVIVLNVVNTNAFLPGDSSMECGALLVGQTGERNGVMGVQCLLVDGYKNIDAGVGVVYLNHTDDLNGSNLNFSLKLAWRVTPRWGLAYRHISNSGTVKPNLGRDMVLLTYRF